MEVVAEAAAASASLTARAHVARWRLIAAAVVVVAALAALWLVVLRPSEPMFPVGGLEGNTARYQQAASEFLTPRAGAALQYVDTVERIVAGSEPDMKLASASADIRATFTAGGSWEVPTILASHSGQARAESNTDVTAAIRDLDAAIADLLSAGRAAADATTRTAVSDGRAQAAAADLRRAVERAQHAYTTLTSR